MGYSIYQRFRFVKVEGEVISNGWRNVEGTESVENYAVVRYQANGETWQTRVQVVFRAGVQEGAKKTIYYNPENPSDVLNPLQLPFAAVLLVICTLAALVVWKQK